MPETYQLYYWPMLPGRGELVRLVLEEAGAPYVDVAREQGVEAIVPKLHGGGDGPPLYAPPFLRSGDLWLSQTAAICDFLAARHGLVPEAPEARARALSLFLTVLDVVDEVHDTHHPLGKSKYYEEQKAEAKVASTAFLADRLPKLLGYLERALAHGGGEWFLGTLSYVDLGVYQLLKGLEHAFPRGSARAFAATPKLCALRARVGARPRVAAFEASARSVPFSQDGIFRRYPELDEG